MNHQPRRARASNRPTLVALLLLLFALVAAACGSDDDDEPAADDSSTETTEAASEEPEEEAATVKVAISLRGELWAPLLLAQKYGAFEERNLTVEFVDIPSSEGLVAAASGDVDVVVSQPSAGFFNAVSSGAGLKIAAGNYVQGESKSGLWARTDAFEDPEDPAVADLAGKKIGSIVGPGSVIGLAIDDLLQSEGLSSSDVTLEQLAAADLLIALQNDAVQAAWLIDPVWAELQDDPNYVYLGGQPADEPYGAYIFGPSMFEKDPSVGARFLAALVATQQEFLDGDYHSDEQVVADLAEETGATVESIRALPSWEFNFDFQDRTIERAQEVYLETPDLLEYDEPLPADEVMDLSFLEEAKSRVSG